MKNQLQTLRRKAALAVVGGALLAPLFGSATVSQAAPRQPWPGVNRNRSNQNRVLTGVVQRDLAGRDRFTVRANNGRNTEVISRRNEPLRLSKGDVVEMRGDFERGLFVADSVRILSNNRNNGWNNGRPGGFNGRENRLTGRAIGDYRGVSFAIRTNGGRVVTVRALNNRRVRMSKDDYVEVRGSFNSGVFLATDVDVSRR